MATPHQPSFASLEEIFARAAESLRPPERLTVPEAAEKYRYLSNEGGGVVGPFSHDRTPYMREPEEVLTSSEYQGMVFVGPSQSGKTEGLPNWIVHSVICDPADMMVVAPTNTAARYFSKTRLTKLWMDTPALKEYMMKGRNSQNVFDMRFRNGMYLSLSHPSIGELRGKPIPRIWITDYDAIDLDVDGEGDAYGLARARTTTFGRFGMTVAESTPGHELEDYKWIARSKHEGPPAKGIMSLYNQGDRRRWYWKCPACEEAFEPEFKLLRYPEEGDDIFRAEHAVMACPNCDHEIEHSQKFELNLNGKWIQDGCKWEKDGRVTGVPTSRSYIASFWLKGVAAGLMDWSIIVLDWLKALEEYENTGNEQPLKVVTNTRLGEPYTPKALELERLPEELKSRAEDWGGTAEDPVVPDGVRYLTATIDVQAGSRPAFVVHVYGHGVGGDVWHVAMFKIRKSNRIDNDGFNEDIDPASYPEDWRLIIDQVIERSYPLNDGSGRRMLIKMVGCDSGGAEGVTTNAYNFWRYLRDEYGSEGYHKRFQLLKGEPSKTAQRYVIKFPDSQRKDRNAGARGDIPVGFINSNTQKDTIYAMLGRTEPGGGMIHFPKWAEDWLYLQLTAEQRTPKGWVATSRRRNEAFDLLYYAVSLGIDQRIRAERLDWDKPPGWAEEWDSNDLIVAGDAAGLVAPKKRRSLRELGNKLL